MHRTAPLFHDRAAVQPPASRPAHYVRIPIRLIEACAYHPLPIGVYGLVARLYLIYHTPIALSAADLTRYDPSLSRGAAERALTHLVAGGWLVAAHTAGMKTRYTPTWGRVHAAPLPWQLDAPCFGRPRHVRAVVCDVRLLDVMLGKCTPHATRSAIITRYLVQPALTLADVGGYALALAGLPGSTPALAAWQLVVGGHPHPLPATEVLLAGASQQALTTPEAGLSAQGLRRLGHNAAAAGSSTAQPLFFLPPDMIGTVPAMLPATMIAHTIPQNRPNSAVERGKSVVPVSLDAISWESRENKESQGTPPPGGEMVMCDARVDEPPTASDARRSHAAAAHTALHASALLDNSAPPTVQALRALRVRPRVVTELMDAPFAAVEAAIRHGEARPAVSDLAGWVVSLLRTARHADWHIPVTAPATEGVDWAAEQRKALADGRITSESCGATTHDSPRALPVGPDCNTLWDAAAEDQDSGHNAAINLPAASMYPSTRMVSDTDILRALHTDMQWMFPRPVWGSLERLACGNHGAIRTLVCANRIDWAALQRHLPTLTAALRTLGWNEPFQLVIGVPGR
ncbi:MAG: hypothetical protein H7Z42_14450 [Roseiflexaceae bacterium]|nr:hypothetical protein [Roseiflexaceae bacterium]